MKFFFGSWGILTTPNELCLAHFQTMCGFAWEWCNLILHVLQKDLKFFLVYLLLIIINLHVLNSTPKREDTYY